MPPTPMRITIRPISNLRLPNGFTKKNETVEPESANHDSREESDQENICSICFENPKFSLVTTNCGHKFCFDCYQSHVNSGQNYSHKCPTCRKPISEIGENLVKREEYLASLPVEEDDYSDGEDDMISESDNYTNPEFWRRLGIIFSETPDATIDWSNFFNVPLEQALPPVHNRTPTRPRNRVPSSRRRGTRSNPAEPRYSEYPGYNGPWTVSGHPDRRSSAYALWITSSDWRPSI